MSNIHTLADYRESGGPNRAAIPNPWATASSTTSSYDDGWSRSPSLPSSYPDTSSRYFIRLQGLEGEERMVSMEEFKERPFATTGQLCCMHCCPCFFMSNRTKALKTLLSFCALISIVQVVMLVEALAMGGFAPLHENPMIGPPTDTLVKLGAKDVDLIKEDYQVWRFITPVFLHAGIIHLFFNLLFQLRFGLLMEREWGVLRFFALYTVSAVGGNLMSCLLRPGSISVGASTALMGLLGGNLTKIVLEWHNLDPRIRKTNLIMAILPIVVIMLISAVSIIDAAGHFGGLVVGAIMGGVLFSHTNTLNYKVTIPLSLALLLAYFIGGMLLFYFAV
ncbi:Rho1-Guanine Exchange Factor-like protein [Balamuthia mandrillaris]